MFILEILHDIIAILIQVVFVLVLVQFVLSLLMAFNVVNVHNEFVSAVWRSLNALMEPILSPIRRIMPATGAIDFSPLVLIVLLYILQAILSRSIEAMQ